MTWPHAPSAAAPTSWRRFVVAFLWAMVAASMLIAILSFGMWRRDLAEIRRIVATEIDGEASPAEIISQTRDFMRDHVGYGRHGSYFLLPAFSFMRPTARQVIRDGGDCAYRTRAFIVILRLFDVDARKLALYDRLGRPVHAVAEIRTDDPPYYVDLLFNLAHEHPDGTPLTLAELADDAVLRGSIERALAEGNEQAAGYPLEWYTFQDARTLNWDKNVVTRVAFRVLTATIGEEAARAMPRPYLSEEPALMVIVLAGGNSAFALLLIVLVRVRTPRPASPRPQPGEPERARVHSRS